MFYRSHRKGSRYPKKRRIFNCKCEVDSIPCSCAHGFVGNAENDKPSASWSPARDSLVFCSKLATYQTCDVCMFTAKICVLYSIHMVIMKIASKINHSLIYHRYTVPWLI